MTHLIDPRIADLRGRERICWTMASVFLSNHDEHGLMGIAAELQSIRFAIKFLSRDVEPVRAD